MKTINSGENWNQNKEIFKSGNIFPLSMPSSNPAYATLEGACKNT